jgi:T5SS/PEP-CTERM-associated repeat protein
MRRHFPSRLAERLFVCRACALVFAVLLAPSGVRADQWSGIGSDWFATTSWSLGNNGPPGTTENAFFNDSSSGVPLAVTNVQLSASTTIHSLSVDSPMTKQYTFTGANGAVLTATSQMDFANEDRQALNVHTIESLRLNTPDVDVFDNAILSLNNSTVTTNFIETIADGRIDVNSGSSVQTLRYGFVQAAGELRVNSGGELRIADDTTLQRGTTTINSGGQLNALPGVDLEYTNTALLQFTDSHTVDDGVSLRVTDGADVTAGEYIDVGNGAVGSLLVSGDGSTLTAQNSISDWGAGSAGNATVTITFSGVATASQLRAGTGNAVFQGNLSSDGTLRTTSTFRMGGGSTVRTVALNVDGGTLETNGLATFDNLADLNLFSGTVNFNAGATFNSGSRFDWSGGSLNLGAGTTLLVDAGVVNRTIAGGFIFSDNTTTRIRNGGGFTTPDYFDLGSATLDMNNGGLTVGATGGTISDWGGNGATTTATLTNNAVATYNSGLRMGVFGSGGTVNATISGGARLVSNGSFSAGGVAASNVTLDVTGGRLESDGVIVLERGATTTVSAAGVMEGQNIVLGSSGGTTSTTVTGVNSLLKSRGTLTAGRAGSSTLLVLAGAEAESMGATVVGELAGASANLIVSGSGSKLDVGTTLTVAAAGAGTLAVNSGGFVAVAGGVTVGSGGLLGMSDGGSLEITAGQSIANAGNVTLFSGSQLRADVMNSGLLLLENASTTRGVTLLANSQMRAENSTVGSLTQQPTADIEFRLGSLASFDNFGVTGAASLNGDIVITLLGGYAPALGDQFQVLTASSISGTPTFDFSAASLGSGLAWLPIQTSTSLTLAVIPSSTPGDFDHDGDVDGQDVLVWQRNTAIGNLADWRNNFGAGALVAASTAVPEPSTWILLTLAAVGYGNTRIRRIG